VVSEESAFLYFQIDSNNFGDTTLRLETSP
jgi:hypothetical protein